MTKKSTGYKFYDHHIVKSEEFGYFGKVIKLHPECPHSNDWLEFQAIPIKAEHVRMPWYGIQLLDGSIVTRPEVDLLFATYEELFDMQAKEPKYDDDSDSDCDYVSDTSEGDGSESESESSESESDSESENKSNDKPETPAYDPNAKTCEYILRVMLTPTQLETISYLKPVVSFTI